MNVLHRILIVSVTLLSLGYIAFAQDKKKDAPADKKKAAPIAPAEAVQEGWDEIDQRLIFLMIRLANTESSLEAVEKVIGTNSRKQSVKLGDAKRKIGENEKMDEKGGGPMKWSQFYGTTAEKFFYHPTDRNSFYHTQTVLTPQPPQNDNQTGPGIPSRQGLPVHQRPPQFDYIYKANRDAASRADAEASQLKNKVDALLERRQRLEAEQAILWCEIAFHAVDHFDLDKKPLFRFEPLLVGNDADVKRQIGIVKSAVEFMRIALAILRDAQKDQATTFNRIKPAISQSRQLLNDEWLKLAVDASDKNSTEGKFVALAKRLNDMANNLSESYEVSVEGDQENDQQRKETFRGQLQQSLIGYAQIVLALDEMAIEMRDTWKIKPDLEKPMPEVSLVKYGEARQSVVKPTVATPKNVDVKRKPAGKKAVKKGAGKFQFSEGFPFNNEKQIKKSWNINAAENLWSIQNNGLKFAHGQGFPTAELVSKHLFSGEMAVEVIGNVEIYSTVRVRLCGENIEVNGPAEIRIQILRRDNTLLVRNNGRDYTIQLKESWDDKPTDIRVHWSISANTASSAVLKSIGVKAMEADLKELDQ